MESPVRICLGATVVVNLLLLCGALPGGILTPSENTTSLLVNNEKILSSRFSRANGTSWVPRGRPKNKEILNAISPKDSSSEEQADAKNAKYKDRGRVKFFTSSQSSTSTFKPRRMVKTTSTSTERPEFTIVTPTPQKKNITEILDSMREYKRTKLPISSTTPKTTENVKIVDIESKDDEDDYEEDDEYSYHEDHKSTNFHLNNFFTIPGFDDDFSQHPKNDNNVPKNSYSIPSYDKFSSYFPKDSYSSASHSDSFVEFDLTTPRNDYFDKKFKEVSNSIKKNIATLKIHSPANSTNQKLKQIVDGERFSKGVPTNKSTVYIKNTKEIRLLDNEKAGTDNKELSDVQGTSIYYEMSVLSTETYSIDNSNEDDCDNDTTLLEPTPSTSSEEENASIKAKHNNSLPPEDTNTDSTINNAITPSIQAESSSTRPIHTTDSSLTTMSTGETSTNKFSSSYRNRDYSKRINFSNNREYSNSVTVKPDQVTTASVYKPVTRRIHYPTPKTKPIWMAPRKNYTRPSYIKTTLPTTIYAEHFNIKDAVTSKIKTSNVLTTVSSDIDPILQSDVSGLKKLVHSQTVSDNSIPHLRKRGSMKYTTTASSTEMETETSQDIMDIPSTAWALAALRPSPSMSPAKNVSISKSKSVDDNELQNVDEISDNKETTTSFTRLTTKENVNTDYPSKNIVDVNQNKLGWKPAYTDPTAESDIKTEILHETKTERVPAESNISLQSSAQPSTTETIADKTENSEVSTMITVEETTDAENVKLYENKLLTKPTNATAFESITKLPSGITTPQVEETIAPLTETSVHISSTDLPKVQTKSPNEDDFEVTTIRFTYIPTILDGIIENSEQPVTSYVWHSVTADTTKPPVTEETIVTTYRPKYLTTTDKFEETSTIVPEITTMTEKSTSTNPTIVESQFPTTTTAKESVTLPSIESTPHLETSTIIVEVSTEINTERETRKPTTTMSSLITEQKPETTSNQNVDTVSEENSGSNEVITHIKDTTTQKNRENDDDMTVIPMSKPETEAPTDEVESTEKTEEEQEENELFDKSEIPDKEFKIPKDTTTHIEENLYSDSTRQSIMASTTDDSTTEFVNELEDVFGGDMTTEASSRVVDEAGSGAAIAIAVSTIGVIALILLVGLLLVVRKRGRRGVYAQRCTPVSLDAYSLDSVSVGHRKGNHRLRASKRSYGNPAYDDEVTSHPMTYAALANFALDVDSMAAEFAEIPTVNVRPEEVPLGCEDKNRYSNVLPLPETRVPLQRIGNDPTTEYINANYVTGPGNIKNYYIACQAPLPNTVADFWRMIWEQNSRLIVMLTEYMENGVEKCYEYLPPSEISDNKRTFGDFQIILQKRELRDKYAISTVQLFNLDTRRWREVTHLWYFWPPKGVPDDYDSIIDFLSEMRSYMKISQNGKEYDDQGLEIMSAPESRSSFKIPRVREDWSPNANVYSPQREEMMRRGAATNGTLARMKAASETEGGVRPCVAVCSTGAGRVGLVLALDECARALAAGQADVPRAVRRLRAQRPHALANKHHYMLLYKVLSEYGNKLMGGGVDGI